MSTASEESAESLESPVSHEVREETTIQNSGLMIRGDSRLMERASINLDALVRKLAGWEDTTGGTRQFAVLAVVTDTRIILLRAGTMSTGTGPHDAAIMHYKL